MTFHVDICHSTQEHNVGAYAAFGHTEETLTTLVATEVVRLLNLSPEFKAHLMSGRTATEMKNAANACGGERVLDVHTDAGGAKGTSGLFNKRWKVSTEGQKWISAIYAPVAEYSPGGDNGVYGRDDLVILYGTNAVAGLIELAPHDIPASAKHLVENWREYAKRVAVGVYRYFGVAWPDVALPTPVLDVNFRGGVCAAVDPRFGGSTNFEAIGVAMRDLMRCSWYVVTETTPYMRAAIIRVLSTATGTPWACRPHSAGKLAVFWDVSKWNSRAGREVDFGDSYHGALVVPLVSVKKGLGFDLIGVHTRPKSVATLEQKKGDVLKALGLIQGWPVVFAGDFALDADALCAQANLVRATPDADTLDRDGEQHIDAAYVELGGLIEVRRGSIVNPGGVSDHKWPLLQGTLKKAKPSSL